MIVTVGQCLTFGRVVMLADAMAFHRSGIYPEWDLDLYARHFAKVGALQHYDVMDISDAVMGIFDYRQG